jgi:tetratricopeptide (TPR) repeat protein
MHHVLLERCCHCRRRRCCAAAAANATAAAITATAAALSLSSPLRRLDADYVKAYYRRASANMALGKYKLAVRDLKQVSSQCIKHRKALHRLGFLPRWRHDQRP